MSNKTTSVIAAILTIVLLAVFAMFSTFFEMIALNGVSERQGTIAMGVSLACQGVAAVGFGILAGWISSIVITKFNLNKILAIIIAVALTVPLGVVLSLFSAFLSIPLAGVR